MHPGKERPKFLQHLPSRAGSRKSSSEQEPTVVKIKNTGDRQQQVISVLTGLQNNFNSLLEVVTKRLSYDKTKEAAFDKLYQEMEELKQDQELQQLRPMYIDLILLIDRMNNIYNDKLCSNNSNPEFVQILKTLSHEILEILYRRGVELIVTTSEHFDPKVQRVVEIISTDDPLQDNIVVEMIRHGFKYNEIILRPEEVVIKKYQT